MDASIRTGTPLRQRMIDDMTLRNMAPNTQKAYIRAVANFSSLRHDEEPAAALRRAGIPQPRMTIPARPR